MSVVEVEGLDQVESAKLLAEANLQVQHVGWFLKSKTIWELNQNQIEWKDSIGNVWFTWNLASVWKNNYQFKKRSKFLEPERRSRTGEALQRQPCTANHSGKKSQGKNGKVSGKISTF